MIDEIKEYFSPSLKDANDDEVREIGYAVFGNKISYLASKKPLLLKKFQKFYGLSDFSIVDRRKTKYICEYVELFGNKNLKLSNGMTRNAPSKEMTIKEIINELEKIH